MTENRDKALKKVRCRNCSACNFQNPLGNNYCGRCGQQISRVRPTDVVAKGYPLEPYDERRHLSIMFCDLVGSTSLAEGLDPEDLAVVFSEYRRCCADVVARFAGYVAETQGDGVVIYFGHPDAHEDDAERAVRAALEITRRVPLLHPLPGVSLQARVGIAAGTVLIEDPRGPGSETAIGTTSHRAARIQALAEPNSVVIEDAVHDLIGNLFECADLGNVSVKGLRERVRVWKIIKGRATESRFQALRGTRLSPLVGRDQEIGILRDAWTTAMRESGRVIVLRGEAGIGKSRLVHRLVTETGDAGVCRQLACSSYHINSPLQPIVDYLQRAADIQHGDLPTLRLKKLMSLLGQSKTTPEPILGIYADLLSISDEIPVARKERRTKLEVLKALSGQLLPEKHGQPVLLIFEDVHWIDPTSRELLEFLVRRAKEYPLLIIVTCRQHFFHGWDHLLHVATVEIGRLERESSIQFVTALAGDKRLPRAMLEDIVAKTDGVPLFIEELTKMVVESGGLELGDDAGITVGAKTPLRIPDTLQDLLMARFAHHKSAKRVAQVAATIGRQFPLELLKRVVSNVSRKTLQQALTTLEKAELLYQCESMPPTYAFKHGLVRDAAYTSLTRKYRREYHLRIAKALESDASPVSAPPPEIVAYHFTEAEIPGEAVSYWMLAGRRASERSAHREAASHFQKALGLVPKLEGIEAKARTELSLRIALGAQLTITKGNAEAEVEHAYQRARDLSEQLGETAQLFRSLRGLQTYNLVKGRLRVAEQLGQRLLDIAHDGEDPDYLLQAHRPHALCLLYQGRLSASRFHAEQALSQYRPSRHRAHRFEYGSDPLVLIHCNLAWIDWFSGNADRAVGHCHDALSVAEELEHPHSLSFARSFFASIYQFRCEPIAARRQAEEVIYLAAEHDFAYWHAWGQVLRGWSLAESGELVTGIQELQRGIEAYRLTGAELMRPYFLALLAEQLGRSGRHDLALRLIDEALSRVASGQVRFYEAELYRIKGMVLLHLSGPNGLAKDCLLRAVSVAREQGSKALELRAVLSLAAYYGVCGKPEEGRQAVQSVYNSFSEGRACKDLQEAARLIAIPS